jgi:hypothetical protein
MYVYVYMHIYTHTYIAYMAHKALRRHLGKSYVCVCVHTYIHTYIQDACMHTYFIDTYMQTQMSFACIHAYISRHTCMHTYIHPCIHTQMSFAMVVNGTPWEERKHIINADFAAGRVSRQMMLDLPIGTHSTYMCMCVCMYVCV